MLADVKPLYFWKGMKDATRFVAGCFQCQKVKIEHQLLAGLGQPNAIPDWKWQIINMDFVQGLPMTRNRHNAILMMVDRLTKLAYFILGNLADGAHIVAKKLVQEIFQLHGILEKIILDKDAN